MTRGHVYWDVNRPSPELAQRLGAHSVATLQAAAGGDYLVGDGLRRVHERDRGRSAFGPAVTALAAPSDNLAVHVATATTEPGDVLVVASEGGDSAALWGDLLTALAIARGLAAVIIDGAIRDVAGIRASQFPVWYRSVNPRTTAKARLSGVNIPVVLAGGVVRPGDIVVADDDGIMSIPPTAAEAVLAEAERIETHERELLEHFREGRTYYDIAGLDEILGRTGAVSHDSAWGSHGVEGHQ